MLATLRFSDTWEPTKNMPNTPTRYARVALTTTSATLYTVPAATTAIITEIIINNTTAVDVSPIISLAGVSLLQGETVPANGMLALGMKQILSATETITGVASAAGLNIFISGVNLT